jgi:hypothetical protein
VNVSRILVVAAATALCGITAAPGVAGTPSGTQWSPDFRSLVVQKDVGAERWAISLDIEAHTVTGNVFFSDGRSPAFIWCEPNAPITFDEAANDLFLK